MHGGLLCIAFCLSVCSPGDTFMGRNGHNLSTSGVQTNSWNAKSTCGVNLEIDLVISLTCEL